MPRKTQGVYELVQAVLNTFPQPYGEDIIEDVCLSIENNSDWFRRYNELSDELCDWVVNNWIGQYTKLITGFDSNREVYARRSNIIKYYTKLIPR